MSDEIRVPVDQLELLAKDIRRVTEGLKELKVSSKAIQGAPAVADAYGDFLRGWKKTRDSRVKALETVAMFLETGVEEFTRVDDAGRQALEC